jgi:hypothetical protein
MSSKSSRRRSVDCERVSTFPINAQRLGRFESGRVGMPCDADS